MKITKEDLRKIIQEEYGTLGLTQDHRQDKILQYFNRRNGSFGDVRIMYDILYQVLEKIIGSVDDDVLDEIINQVVDDHN
jgi:hypothetical protein